MGVVVTEGRTFTPAPAGVHQAVCVDVIDLGQQETTWKGQKKMKPMVRLIWQIDETDPETGRRFIVSRRYGAYLSDKASLRKDLQSWRGKPFTPEELKGFDLDTVLGVNCQINIIHRAVEGKTYCNVDGIMPLLRGVPQIKAIDYVRQKDRTPEGDEPANAEFHASDDDVPFAAFLAPLAGLLLAGAQFIA
jgi:hypothetical protein